MGRGGVFPGAAAKSPSWTWDFGSVGNSDPYDMSPSSFLSELPRQAGLPRGGERVWGCLLYPLGPLGTMRESVLKRSHKKVIVRWQKGFKAYAHTRQAMGNGKDMNVALLYPKYETCVAWERSNTSFRHKGGSPRPQSSQGRHCSLQKEKNVPWGQGMLSTKPLSLSLEGWLKMEEEKNAHYKQN